jgi:hypothetical protein
MERTFNIEVGREALDGLGDPSDPQSEGLAMLLKQVRIELQRQLHIAGWPEPKTPFTGLVRRVRPADSSSKRTAMRTKAKAPSPPKGGKR